MFLQSYKRVRKASRNGRRPPRIFLGPNEPMGDAEVWYADEKCIVGADCGRIGVPSAVIAPRSAESGAVVGWW
jgi:hypothetical protein